MSDGPFRLDFDRRLMLQVRGSLVTSDAGLLAYRELDDVLGLSALAGEMLADARTGKNGRHALVGMLRHPCSVECAVCVLAHFHRRPYRGSIDTAFSSAPRVDVTCLGE